MAHLNLPKARQRPCRRRGSEHRPEAVRRMTIVAKLVGIQGLCQTAANVVAERNRTQKRRAVAPFPLPKVDAVFMDKTLYRHGLVWAGAGSSRHILGINPTELGRLARARPMDVVVEQPYDSSTHKES